MLFQTAYRAPFKIDSTLAINNIAFKYFSRRISRFNQADSGLKPIQVQPGKVHDAVIVPD